MTLGGVETLQASSQALSASVHDRKALEETKAIQNGPDKSKEKPSLTAPSPVQDQVTLSKEAQTLSTSNSQNQPDKSFQQSPSPLDK